MSKLFKKASIGGKALKTALVLGGGIGSAAYINKVTDNYLQKRLQNSGTAEEIGNAQQQLEDLGQHGMTGGPMWNNATNRYDRLVKNYKKNSDRIRKGTYGLGVSAGIGTALLTSKLLKKV